MKTSRLFGLALATLAFAAVLLTPPASQAAPTLFERTNGTLRTSISGNVTTVSDDAGWLATYTKGARTVTMRGPSRTFTELGTLVVVNSNVWVRLLPAPFSGTVDQTWLNSALANRTPDALALAFQYVSGAVVLRVADLQIGGDADYGPVGPNGLRLPGADFNDYLGIPWTYGTYTDQPETAERRALDCSGYVRMVYGYRMQYPMTLSPATARLPRTAQAMSASGPGAMIVSNTGTQAAVSPAIRPGDLVFFDASTGDGTVIDHTGIYLGRDLGGHARFISSRRSANGPTMSDAGAYSYIDGTGMYARAFRSVRRL